MKRSSFWFVVPALALAACNTQTGSNVAKPGTFPLIGDMNVLQLIALGGGLVEYADSKNITIMRNEGGKQLVFKFNYKDVTKGKHVEQNIVLKPGDTVVVP